MQDVLFTLAAKMGHISGVLKGLPESTQTETVLDLMVSEAIKTSAIEGEILSRADVMSSVRNQLALNVPPQAVRDPRASGAAELMMDVRRSFAEVLSEEKLFAWHRMLLSSRMEHMRVGAWRIHSEPMHVVSGPVGKIKVHFEALPSQRATYSTCTASEFCNALARAGVLATNWCFDCAYRAF